MLTNSEKINLIINRINNLSDMMKSFIEYSDICKDKYSLEEQLNICTLRKDVLEKELEILASSS